LVNYGVVEGVRSSVIPVSPNVDGAASAAVPATIPLRAQWAVAGCWCWRCYLGLLPLLLGLRAAWKLYRDRHAASEDTDEKPADDKGAGILQVATVTFANGGDNIGVHVPVFAVAGTGGMIGYVVVFLIGVALWCAIGWFLASRPLVTKALSRWGRRGRGISPKGRRSLPASSKILRRTPRPLPILLAKQSRERRR